MTLHPDFVAEIARVTRAGDVDGASRDRPARDAKVFQAIDICVGDSAQKLRGRWSLHRERGDALRDGADLRGEPAGLMGDPSQIRVRGGPPKSMFLEAAHRAVVDDIALLVAPGRVDDLTDFKRACVARDHAIDKLGGVAAGDE